uniref:EF-hand_14 domain-containing protein n=1 Tax=Angiostrongylus cantonensis TaxID=6313 RepID=A0A0K0D082_ANGCA
MNGFLERSVSASSLSLTLQGLMNPYEKEFNKGKEDAIFEMFKIPGKNQASIGRLLTILKSLGLRMDDPRLKSMMRHLKEIEKQEEAKTNEVTEPKRWKLNKELFKECVALSVDLISQALQNNLVIPSWSKFVEQIKIFYLEVSDLAIISNILTL